MVGQLVCPGRNSNPHGLSAGNMSGCCVYQFHHPGTRMRTVVPAPRHDPPRGLRPATRKVMPTKWWAVTEMPRRRIGIARPGGRPCCAPVRPCPCAP